MKFLANRRRAIFIFIFLVGCAGRPDLSQSPEIVYGEDICDECNMIISEPRFAAAYYTVDGVARRFDDIGDMCTYYGIHQEEVARFWVHDYNTEAWLQADKAFFVMSDQVYTPMAFGVVAFRERGDAERFAAEVEGLLIGFDDLLEHYGIAGPAHDHKAEGG